MPNSDIASAFIILDTFKSDCDTNKSEILSFLLLETSH